MYLGNGCLRRCKSDLSLTFNRPQHHPRIRHHTCTTQQRFIPTFQTSSLPQQARPRYRKERAWTYAHFHPHLQHARTPAHTCIQMAAMNLHCIYRCGKRPFYKWLLMMPLHCKESDNGGEIFRERESERERAGSFYSSLNLKTNPGGSDITLIYQPVSGLCVYDFISACLNQIERNPKRTDQCWDRQYGEHILICRWYITAIIQLK